MMAQQPDEKMSRQVKREAESILRRMDEQLIDLVEYEPIVKAMNSPEREVHVDEGLVNLQRNDNILNLTVGYSEAPNQGDPRYMLVKCSSMVRQGRNPEDTSPVTAACDGWSFSSIPSSQLNGSVAKRRSTYLLEDDESEVSLLLDEEESLIPPPPPEKSGDLYDDEESIMSIQDAVDAIREEASRMETAFAIDRFQTLQTELRSMKKLLQAQADKIGHLERALEAKDEQLATVELERDLVRADLEALRVGRDVAASSDVKPMTSPVGSFATSTCSIKGQELSLASGATLASSEASPPAARRHIVTSTSHIKRLEVDSPLGSFTGGGSVKSQAADSSLHSGATVATFSEGSPQTGKNLCQVEMTAAIQEMQRSSLSISTKRVEVDSPTFSASSGGSTQLEEYLCNLDLTALQERRKPVPLSTCGKELQPKSVAVASSTEDCSSAESSSSSSSGQEGSGRSDCTVGATPYRGPSMTIELGRSCNVADQPMEQASNVSSTLSNDKKREVRPLALRQAVTKKGTRIPASVRRKPVVARATVNSNKGLKPIGTLNSSEGKVDRVHHSMYGQNINASASQEDSSQTSSHASSSKGSSKENRLPKKKPSHFKPIHPGKDKVKLPEKVHAPIPLKGSSPSSLSLNENNSVKENCASRGSAQNSLASNSLLEGSPSTAQPERQFFGTPKADRSGALGLEKGKESEALKQRKSSGPLFRRRKSKAADVHGKDMSKRNSLSSVCLEENESLQTQVEELAQRLRRSVEGSEDLRKRLAMISRYYETTVHRLSENIVSLKKDQAAMQTDLTQQIKCIDRERLVAIKRTELLLKEQQIAKFKKKQQPRMPIRVS